MFKRTITPMVIVEYVMLGLSVLLLFYLLFWVSVKDFYTEELPSIALLGITICICAGLTQWLKRKNVAGGSYAFTLLPAQDNPYAEQIIAKLKAQGKPIPESLQPKPAQPEQSAIPTDRVWGQLANPAANTWGQVPATPETPAAAPPPDQTPEPPSAPKSWG